MRKTVLFLKSDSFIFISVLFVLTGQTVHTLTLFENLRRIDMSFVANGHTILAFNWIHAFLCAAAVEAAILMFLINGKKLAANIYALASFITNILYYHYWDGRIEDLISSTLLSAMLSGSIWFFSGLFAEKISAAEYTEDSIKDYLQSAKDELDKNVLPFTVNNNSTDYVGKKGL
jgi:hypothetical protein